MSSPIHQQWTHKNQCSFETQLVRLTASAGFLLSWVDNPEWIGFCDEFIPGGHNPSRKSLTRRLLPAAINKLHAEAQQQTVGANVTLQEDGGTGTNKHSLMAFMITANGKVFFPV
ncbi:hypothetical protein B0H10DRAFT_1807004 [Mycena sp. CBHHK59/15]|nr:hypothetical protein B0H10DRAFT_1807004 [Mycena sp. CBHHK59/15]